MSLSNLFSRPLLFLLLLSCGGRIKDSIPPILSAKVIAVKDGDTIEMLYDGKPLRIRLAHIDCPEIKKGQPFGKDAKQLASDLCFGQLVKVLNDGKLDRYGRLIGVIINSSNQNVNKELIKAGLAWHFTRYSSETTYAALENVARAKKLGLWTDANPVPPWNWRKKGASVKQ